MDSTYLKYGDYVVLFNDSNKGYLYSSGQNDPNLFVQQLEENASIKTVNCFRKYVFQVTPKLSYDGLRELQKFKKNRLISNKKASGQSQTGAVRGFSTGADAKAQMKLMMLIDRELAEQKQNKKLIQSRIGEYITYGMEIQLKHVDSELFMIAESNCAILDKSCLKISLIEKGSRKSLFKVLPRYKFRQEGKIN